MAMRVTRSASRATPYSRASALESPTKSPATLPRLKSKKVPRAGSPTPKGRSTATKSSTSNPAVILPYVEDHYNPVMIPAVLSFSFETAKGHLTEADSRFQVIFDELPCRPFEQLEAVDPFQTLVTSILGQQISWLAARSIRHRFLRLFDPSLPEKAPASNEPPLAYNFPSPGRLAKVDAAILKTAGLSTRKAEYVLDLAARFADGRLSTEKLAKATDEELVEMLTAVRGIGKWTVDMFAMFSLRRPDICAVGDLGLQRGLLRWVLSSHLPDQYPLRLCPKKLPKADTDSAKTEASQVTETEATSTIATDAHLGEPSSVLPAPAGLTAPSKAQDELDLDISSPVSSLAAQTGSISTVKTQSPKQPASRKAGKQKEAAPTRTVSVKATKPIPLPDGITLDLLKSRANGKKAKGGCYLLPGEMHALTEAWAPYRSIGCFYLWALSEDDT